MDDNQTNILVKKNINFYNEKYDFFNYPSSYLKQEFENLKKIYIDSIPNIQELEIYKGEIVGITPKEIIVDIGFKAEGVISCNEFKNKTNFKLGDKIDVMVDKKDYRGECILSYEKATIFKNWKKINSAYTNGEVVLGYVTARTKGGLIVAVFDIECFLPGSHINVKPVRDYDVYVGKTLEVKVVKINPINKNVVVSHKVLIEKDIEKQRVELISKLEKGQVVEGKVKNITPYGAFIDLGGVDALLHITDISWKRIEHPAEELKLDQRIKLVILGVDRDKNRIQLGMKQLNPHPWSFLDADLKAGDKVQGKVSQLTDYGAFIEIHPGVEGLVHVSEMSWSSDLQSAQDFVQIGDKVEAVILVLDRNERKLSLSIKQLTPDPWSNIEARYPVKSKHEGIIHNFTNFGVFVELEPGVRGLIYTQDLSWDKKIKHPSEFCNKNEKIEVIILDIDINSRRIQLGHKQLSDNPWIQHEIYFTVGSIHKGYILSMFDKGALVELKNNLNDKKIESFAPLRHLEKKDKTSAQVDDYIDFKIIDFNKENKRIVVSHTLTFSKKYKSFDERKKVKRKKNIGAPTLGGELDELIKLKHKMEKSKLDNIDLDNKKTNK
jgi:small subunit ribosomal protein S1